MSLSAKFEEYSSFITTQWENTPIKLERVADAVISRSLWRGKKVSYIPSNELNAISKSIAFHSISKRTFMQKVIAIILLAPTVLFAIPVKSVIYLTNKKSSDAHRVISKFAKTDFAIPRPKQWAIDQLYDMLEVTDEIFEKLGIKYSLIGGDLLGALRHKGKIPWDDDADISVMDDLFRSKLQEVRKAYEGRGYLFASFKGIWKIWKKGAKLTSAGTGYPALDIFTVKEEDGKLRYASPWSKKFKDYLTVDEWKGIVKQPYGHLMLSVPVESAMRRYCDDTYGSDWHEIAYRTYDHKQEKYSPPTKVRIVNYRPALHSKQSYTNDRK